MDFSSVFYAALGGAIGGGLSAFIASKLDPEGTNKSLRAVLTAVLVVAGYLTSTSLYKNMTFPRIFPLKSSELKEGIPYIDEIQSENPAAYRALVKPIDKMVRNGKLTEAGVNEFRVSFEKVLETKRLTASAETLRAEYEVAALQFEILKPVKPEVCTQKLHGRPYSVINELLSQDYITKEQKSQAGYFVNKPRPEGVVIDESDGQKSFESLTQTLLTKIAIENLDPAITTDGSNISEHRKICDFHIQLNRKVVELPDDKLFNVVAYLGSNNP